MKLIHLFPDLMNLYGDYGSVALLRQHLAQRQVETELVLLRPGQPLELEDAGLIYMGPGTEPARDAALGHLRPLAETLREGMDRGIPMLFTGNSWLTLGRTLQNPDGEVLAGLGLLDFAAAESRERRTGDAVALPCAPGLPDLPAVGYQNRCDWVEGVSDPLFTLELGRGNTPDSPLEGLRAGNLLATHLLGPLLVKNPHLLAWVAELLGADPEMEADPASHAHLAYQTTLAALRARES